MRYCCRAWPWAGRGETSLGWGWVGTGARVGWVLTCTSPPVFRVSKENIMMLGRWCNDCATLSYLTNMPIEAVVKRVCCSA